MDSKELLNEIGDRLGLPAGQLHQPEGCGFDFEDHLHIDAYYAAEQDKLFLCAEVGAIYEAEKGNLMRTLLVANLAPAALADGHFALDADANAITLSRTLPLENQTSEAVVDAIDALATTCRNWRNALTSEQLLLA